MGGISTCTVKLAMMPLNQSKLMFQVQRELLRQGQLERPFVGLADVFVGTLRMKGLQGLLPALLDAMLYLPTQIIHGLCRDRYRAALSFDRKKSGHALWMLGGCIPPSGDDGSRAFLD